MFITKLLSPVYQDFFYEKNSMASNIVGLLTKYLGIMEIFTWGYEGTFCSDRALFFKN